MTVKITIEEDGKETMVLDFDTATIRMDQEVYNFFEYGGLVAKDAATDGTQVVTIIGVRENVRQRFQKLCSKYPIVSR